MREIRFRAWGEENKKMIEPFEVGSELSECWPPEMQYTGKLDKKGAKIYEGDLLKYSGDKCPHCGKAFYEHLDLYEVVWDEDSLCFDAINDDNSISPASWSTDTEIVSNICENSTRNPMRITEKNAD